MLSVLTFHKRICYLNVDLVRYTSNEQKNHRYKIAKVAVPYSRIIHRMKT